LAAYGLDGRGSILGMGKRFSSTTQHPGTITTVVFLHYVGHRAYFIAIQGVPGGKFSILGGRSIGHFEQKVYMYICPISNGYRDRAISFYCTLYRRATRHVLTRVAKCIDVDG
jgi:hypothetical protein